LHRRVRAAVASSLSEEEFFARLADDGVKVRLRPSKTNPGEFTGFSVALSTDRDKDGEPVWFSGGKLAADLTLPKLRLRWSTDGAPASRTGSDEVVRVSPAERARVLSDAAQTAAMASDEICRLAGSDPGAAQAMAQAAADTLTAVASSLEGRRGGPLNEAGEMFDKAACAGYAKVARATSRSYELRAMSRLIRLMGRISGDEDTFALLALVLDLARLGDTLAWWRQAQDRWHQADAAREAAHTLRAWHAAGVRPGRVERLECPIRSKAARARPKRTPAGLEEARRLA
jgi:hypothetical protein